jgi:lipopolysaccharide/colanic/teichoic acid biosynthesis glycosyltransferase
MEPARTRHRIQVEWEIAERTDQPFSVLVFRTENPRHNPIPALSLLRRLRASLRPGDEVGWLDRYRLAVLLPLVDAAAAHALGEMIVRQEAQVRRAVQFKVHSRNRGPDPPPGVAHDVGRAPSVLAAPPGALIHDPLPLSKRGLDIVFASLGLILLAPVCLAAAILVRLDSPGPIIFRQRRAGRRGVPFVTYKFRTMVDGAEAMKAGLLARNERTGPIFKIARDPRITRVGRLLRKTSIDELPQLWNVLKGDMSLVGPRPPTLDEVAQYRSWQHRRLDVTPGITCTWQVENRGGSNFVDWVRRDLRYIQRRSMWLDVSLLARTVVAVLRTRGAS